MNCLLYIIGHGRAGAQISVVQQWVDVCIDSRSPSARLHFPLIFSGMNSDVSRLCDLQIIHLIFCLLAVAFPQNIDSLCCLKKKWPFCFNGDGSVYRAWAWKLYFCTFHVLLCWFGMFPGFACSWASAIP